MNGGEHEQGRGGKKGLEGENQHRCLMILAVKLSSTPQVLSSVNIPEGMEHCILGWKRNKQVSHQKTQGWRRF